MSCINVVLVGTGSAINPWRGQVSVILDMGGSPVVVDVGCQAPNIAERVGYRLDEIEHYIITHTHYDHLCGLPMIAFMKTFRSREPELLVYTTTSGKENVENLLKHIISDKDAKYKVQTAKLGTIIQVGDGRVKFIEAEHIIETLSVIVEYSKLKVLISSDTRPTRAYKEEAEKSQLAIHEATLPSNMREEAIRTGHSTVEEALKQVIGADQAILYHLTTWSELEALEASKMNKKVIVAPEGTLIRIC